MMEALKWIIYYATTLFTVIISNLIFEKLSGKKYELTRWNVIITSIFALAALYNNMFLSNAIKLINAYVLISILNYLLFPNTKLKTAIYYTIIQVIGCMIVEIFLMLMLPPLGITDIEIINESIALKVIYNIITYGIGFFILSLKKSVKLINLFEERVNKFIKYETILILLVIFFNVIANISAYNYDDIFAMYHNLLFSLVILILGIIILNINKENKSTQEKNDELYNSIKEHEITAEDYRILKHNLINDLLTIKTACHIDAQEVVNEMIKKYKKDYAWISKINSMPYGLKGLIYLKLNTIKNTKVKYSVECNVDDDFFNKMKKSYYTSLCLAIGIYFDNAIEAATNSINKTIYVSMTKVNDKVCVSIANSFNNPVDVDLIGKKNYSTKHIKSGIGLFFALKAAKKKFEISRIVTNNIFVTQIHI